MHPSDHRTGPSARRWLTLAAAAVLSAGSLLAQDGDLNWRSHWEVGGFGGPQFWRALTKNNPNPTQVGVGPLFGGRVSYDFSPRWAAETQLGFGWNREKFQLAPTGVNRLDFRMRTIQWTAGPMYYLSTNSRIRPFVTFAPLLQGFSPSSDGLTKEGVFNATGFGLGNLRLKSNFSGGFAYGGGIKAWLTDRANLRVDLRGTSVASPYLTYIGDSSNLAVRGFREGVRGWGHGVQLLVGLGFTLDGPAWEGGSAPAPAPVRPAAAAPAATLGKDMQLALAGPERTVWQGEKAWFGANSTIAPGGNATYNWAVNGNPAGSGQIITVDTTGMKPGRYPVQVNATAPGYDAASANGALIVKKRKSNDILLALEAPDKKVYQGESATMKLLATVPNGLSPTYNWAIGGQPAGSGETITVGTENRNPGVYLVQVDAAGEKVRPSTAYGLLTVLPRKDLALSVSGPSSAVQGNKVAFNASADASGANLVYDWTVDGKPAGSGSTLNLDTTGLSVGSHEICASTKQTGPYNAAKKCTTFNVIAPEPLRLSVSAPAEVAFGEPVSVSSQVRPATGATPGSVTYTASEGTISPDGRLDTSSLNWDPSNPNEQRKTVTITARVADNKGNVSTSTTQVVVVRKANPKAIRLSDLIFPAGLSRVNNCGKRVLLEELKAYLDKDPSGKVLLIGHFDDKEPGRRKKGEKLDVSRAKQAAAVLTAAQGICLSVDGGRVMIGADSTDTSRAPQPNVCGTSATERKGQAVAENDARAQYRRVEVWFVPSGAAVPEGLPQLKSATEMGVAKLGCPK